MKVLKITMLAAIIGCGGTVQAECSFKVINHSTKSFEEMKAKASIYNLAIPVCTQNPQIEKDPLTKINCAGAPQNILFEHPMYPNTCHATNGWKVYLQFESQTRVCASKKPQSTIDHHVVLNYPEDFDCVN